MEFSTVLQSVLMIAAMIAIGAIISSTFPFNGDTRKVFVSIIVNVAMPCIILSSIFEMDIDEQIFQKIWIVLCMSIAINLLGIGLGWLLAAAGKSPRRRETALLSGLGNTGFIGIPLCAALLGPEGALLAAIFDAGVDLVIWTVGVMMLQKRGDFSLRGLKSMVNVPMIAIAVGLLLAYFNLKPPEWVIGLTDKLAALAAPMAMFYIGVLIMSMKLAKVRESGPRFGIPLLVKLILLPLTVALVIYGFPFDSVMMQTMLIQSMMPTITVASILFAKFSADEEMGALTTVVSTIVSLGTIPLMIYLVIG
jgi:hypothetical protein